MLLVVLVGAAVVCCSVLLVFGCVCHLFKRHGFTNFEDDVEGGRGVSMYSANESAMDTSSVMFEPLPDILAKTVGARALRPRITCIDKDKQKSAAKLVTVYQPFPRNQLIYVKEIGLGWFGQVLQGNAENIVSDSRFSKVVVKILKDDASAAEKSLFLEEVAPYREMDSPNIVKLLGQCTETSPFLTILEFPPMGDLKSYLLAHKRGPFLQFAIDAARGLSCMHKSSYIHHDFATRNCLLMGDLSLKIGDYGIGEDLFREDYYDTGCDLLPIRWMSPESLELKQGVWQLTSFTMQSNVWSLSILLWEILAVGRKPYANLRDEDVLQQVIRDGKTKLPPPRSEIPQHDRWYEIMEMCWQEVDDRPSAEDILAFLQQIDEESVQENGFDKQWNTVAETDEPTEKIGSPSSFSSSFVQSKNRNQSNHHVAEVLVHRVDDIGAKEGFGDDFSKSVKIRVNKASNGFEDDFISGDTSNVSADLTQNDSIVAGINESETFDERHLMPDANINLLQEPVPVQMSTPSKYSTLPMGNQSEAFQTANSNQLSQNSRFVTATDGYAHSNGFNGDTVRSEGVGSSDVLRYSRDTSGEKSHNQNTDEGYRTGGNGSSETNGTSNHNGDEHFYKSDLDFDNDLSSDIHEKLNDLDTEKAREIYMSKGAAIPPSSMHKSRSLGTIPEDGIPSDNTSQSGVVFEDPEDTGMNFEWDDYEGEELVGRVRYSSDESVRSPRQVDVEEWPFDQDSSSEGHSKPGSIASDSDAEVKSHSFGSISSIDTRARIASILTNRLNSHINQTNHSYSSQGMFYSFSDYENEPDSPEHAYSEPGHSLQYASADTDYKAAPSMIIDEVIKEEDEEEEEVESDAMPAVDNQGQDDQLIKQELDKIAASVLKTGSIPEVVVSEPTDQMLPSVTTETVA